MGLLLLPGVAARATTDYDSDGDSLIEVKNLEQLNAIRWDLDGDGAVDDTTNQASYAAAFPDPAAGMGCPTNADDADDNDCIGYELSKSLDFNNDASYADTGNKHTWTTGSGWVPIADSAYFTATLDGNNRTIANLYINHTTADYQGLFGFFGGSAAEIRNVRLRDVNVTGQQNVGGLVALNYSGTVSNSQAGGTVTGQQNVGGLVGYSYQGTIRDGSYASGAVSGEQQIGGLVGSSAAGATGATISASHATGTVTGTGPSTNQQDIGGLVGYNDGTIRDNSYATGAVMGNSEVGGLVGLNEGGTISTSHATGNVTGTDMTDNSGRVGGLVGWNNGGTIEDSYHETGAVTGHREVGGLVGWNTGTISTSHATSDVTGTETTFRSTGIGGLVGLNEGDGTIRASYATGTVKGSAGSGEHTGGLAGQNTGTITASYATGDVIGTDYIGGLVGVNSNTRSSTGTGYSIGTISTSYSTGPVVGTTTIGGLVGWNFGAIRASYARGAVSGQSSIGGLVGTNNRDTTVPDAHPTGAIRASYATGDVIGTGMSRVAGGLVGRNWDGASISASYATGRVSATGGVPDPDNAGAFLPISVGGLVGANLESDINIGGIPYKAATVTASYWDTDTSAVVVGIGSDDADDSGAIDGTETVQDGATGQTTSELQTPTDYTDVGSNTEAIYADWNLNLDDDLNTGDPTTGADDPWDFGTAAQYPVLKVDFNGDGSIDAADIDPQRSSPQPPSPPQPPSRPPSSDNGGSSSKRSSSRAPSPPPAPTRSPIIGSTSAATAVELAGDLLVIQRHDQPGVEVEVGIGWMSQDGQRIIVIGFVRDGDLGQTYAVVRREGDGQVVRRWIAPDSHLVYAVPWAVVNTQYTFPVGVILAIPLDDQYPPPNMLTRRFDGGDDRILAYDAGLGQWRHVPDLATFQALGFYWCNVTAADAGFFSRITLGPPYPASDVPARADYPVCQT